MLETVQRPIFLIVGDDTFASAVLHEQVHGKVLDEEIGIVAKRLTVESVKESVSSPIGC